MPDILEQIAAIKSPNSGGDVLPPDSETDVLSQLERFPDTGNVVGRIASSSGKALANLSLDALSGVEELFDLTGEKVDELFDIDLGISGKDRISDAIRESAGDSLEIKGSGVPETVGQAIGGVAPSFIIGATAGLPAVVAVFASANFGRAMREAEEAGLDEDRQLIFGGLNAGLALGEAIPVARTLKILNKGTGGLVTKVAKAGGGESVKGVIEKVSKTKSGKALLSILNAAPEEAAQESLLSQLPENVLAKAFDVDPNRGLFDGVKEAAVIGAIGGVAGAAGNVGLNLARKGQKSQEEQDEDEILSRIEAFDPDSGISDIPDPLESLESLDSPDVSEDLSPDIQTPEPATVDTTPTASEIKDFSKPTSERSSVGDQGLGVEPDQRVISEEGTVHTTPRQEDLEEQAKRVLDKEVEVPGRGKTTGQKLQQEARDEGLISQSRKIADEVLTSRDPRPLSAKEVVALTQRLEELELNDIKLSKKLNEEDLGLNEQIELGTEISRGMEDFEAIFQALHVTGSDAALALRARRFVINNSFNISTIKARMKAAKQGAISEKDAREAQDLVDRMREVNEKLIEAEERVRELEAEAEMKSATKRKKRKKSDLKKSIDKIALLAKGGCIDG